MFVTVSLGTKLSSRNYNSFIYFHDLTKTSAVSSIVNEDIREILNLFIFLQEDFTCKNSTKSIKILKSTKSTKRQTSDFLPLGCFYVHKNAVFFVFVRLYVFCAFCTCEIFM